MHANDSVFRCDMACIEKNECFRGSKTTKKPTSSNPTKNPLSVFLPSSFTSYGTTSVHEFSFIAQIVYFEIPLNGAYKVECWGGSGGGTLSAPRGAYSKSFFTFKAGEIIKILVGESGYDGKNDGNSIYCGGGGGGTFVAKGNIPICVAGGGGSLTLSGTSPTPCSYGQSTELGGNPGTGLGLLQQGGKGGGSFSGGGGGFIGNGFDGTSHGKGGISFINGGSKQTSGTNGKYGYGGFGGGGSNHGFCGHAAGGGGYTGGSASSSNSVPGGGGGSYHIGHFKLEESISISGDQTYPQNPSNSKNGFAIITFLTNQLKTQNQQCQITFSTNIIFMQSLYAS